jgi:hypothetical protein
MENQVKDLTVEELEQMLQEKKAAETAKRAKERELYELERTTFVNKVFGEAVAYNEIMRDFKNNLHKEFVKWEERLNEYGGIRSNSKGGFSLVSADGQKKVTRIRATKPEWDERSKKGEALIIAFLSDKIKDEKIHKLVMSFLERNEQGELEYARVMNLLNMKSDFDDERWLEGLTLMQESYSLNLRAYNYLFKQLDETGKWRNVDINFSSI